MPVDLDALHGREVDHEAAIAHRGAGDVVAAAADRHEQIVLARETHRPDDVAGLRTAHDHGGSSIDHAVPDRASLVVVGRVGPDHATVKASGERFETVPADGRRSDGRRIAHGSTPDSALSSEAEDFPRRCVDLKFRI